MDNMGKDFIINDYLSVRLEGSKTFIYIKGKRFRQCKYMLLNIPINHLDQYYEINSMDDIIYNLDNTLEQHPELISPEVEFWGHCSNLQAWAENNYNTDLLDIILSFPILKQLYREGDSKAIKVFKEEIAKRLMRGNLYIVDHLIYREYLKFLTYEELTSVLNSEDCPLFERIFNVFKSDNSENFSVAERIYNNIGKHLYSAAKKKIRNIFEVKNVEDLCIIFNYRMLEVFSEEEIKILFDPSMNLLEKTLKIFNNTPYKDIKIEMGLISEKIEIFLGEKIREILSKIIYNSEINYSVLMSLNLVKYLDMNNIVFFSEFNIKRVFF